MAINKVTKDMDIITKLSALPNATDGLTYQEFQAKFDEGGLALKNYINNTLIPALEAVTDADSGADKIGATTIADLDGATVQAILESIRNKLKAVTDGTSGADFVGATGISGVNGNTVQSLIEGLKAYVDANFDTSDEITNNRKLDATGNFTGSWFGFEKPSASDPGIQNQVDKNTAQLAQITNSYVDVVNYNSLQEAISDAKTKGKNVNLNNRTVNINNDVTIDGLEVYNGVINYTAQVSIILKGNKPTLEKVTIESNTYGTGSRGIVELVDTVKATFKGVIINGNNEGKAVFCKTKAINTIIDGLEIDASISWGILFNDGESQQGVGYRTVNSVDYSTDSLGYGLDIKNYKYKNNSPTRYGDGLEVNCPDYGFKDITIDGIRVEGARRYNDTSSNGIGVGFAKCSDVNLNNVKVIDCDYDGIHFEDEGENNRISNFHIERVSRALSLSHLSNVKVKTGTVIDCGVWLASYSNTNSLIPMEHLVLEDVTFNGNEEQAYFGVYGILLSNAKYVKMKDIKCIEFSGSGNIIDFGLSSNLDDVYDSKFEGIEFIKGASTVSPGRLMRFGSNASGNTIKDIKIDGYPTATAFTIDTSKNRLENYVRGDKNGLTLYVSGDPNGYYSAPVGSVAIDTTNGVQYRKASGTGNSGWVEVTPNEVNKDVYVFTGNGETSKSFPHGLSVQPSTYYATPSNSGGGDTGIKYIQVDATNMTIHFNNPAPTGVSIGFRWRVEV